MDKIEKQAKTINDIANNVSAHAKPFITIIKESDSTLGENENQNSVIIEKTCSVNLAVATNDGNLLTLRAF